MAGPDYTQSADALMPPDPRIAGAFAARYGNGASHALPPPAGPVRSPAAVGAPLTAAQRDAIARAQARTQAEERRLAALRASAEQRRQDFLARRQAEAGAQSGAPGDGAGATASPGASDVDASLRLARILRALRAAHDAGDTAAATRLAQMAREAGAGQTGSTGAGAGVGGAAPAAPGAAPIDVELPNGVIARFPAGTSQAVMSGAIERRLLEMEAEQPGSSGLTPQQLEATRRRLGAPPIPGLGVPPGVDANALGGPPSNAAALSALLTREGQAARAAAMPPAPLPRENQWLGGVLPSPRQALRNMGENLDGLLWDGDGDPTTIANRGEALAAALNNAGEAMTFGLVGDEADAAVRGAFAAAVPGGAGYSDTYGQAVADNRAQEAALWEQRPGLAIASELGGALLGPGAPARFINRGVGALSRVGRAAIVGAGSGAVYGAMEGEGDRGRAMGALQSAALGGAGAAALTGLGQGFIRAAQALRRSPGGQEAAASVEGLREAAQRLYGAAEASGATLSGAQVGSLGNGLRRALAREGYNPRLHPRLAVVLDEVDDMAQGAQPLQRVEQLRRIAGNAAQSAQPDEARLGGVILEHIDGAVERMDGGDALRAAREVWGRMRRLERVEEVIARAGNAEAGAFERTLASGFRALLNNPRRARGFNAAERRLMQQIATGSAPVRALRGLAGLLAPNSVSGVAATAGAAYSAGPAALALPLASWGARGAADALVRGQGRALQRLVGQDEAQRAAAEAALMQPNALAGLTTMPNALGEMMRGR